MEITNKGLDPAIETATVLDLDAGLAMIEDDSATVHAQNLHEQVTDADQPTLFAGNKPPESVEDETKRDVPAPKMVVRNPLIKRLFTGEEVLITKPVFCIGRKEDVDYSVTHNPAISRKHAEIIFRNGRYYIHDLGAKNRTYVNGKLLPAKGESELSNGDVIKLANEEFVVWL